MPGWLHIIFKIKHALITFEKVIAASSLLLLLVLAIIQIIARNFFDTGFTHMEIVTRHLILFIIFMGAALVSEQNRHIKIDILTAFLSTEQQEKLIRPLLLLCALISAVFSWYSVGFWLDEWQYAPANERWAVYLALILPVGFFILALHLFLLTITGFEHERVIEDKQSDDDNSCTDIL
ncbi:MAG: TRAP transporter small permease [gamma proteobacterium symbiont of Bathyaustriella thionipta]|nr:TRAP transporter small permease [gamma proteobacterium symbiont of Bathyaustriella thionipta]MCU7951166.1 TRAP transporter small permease [gamma proteobacterium symbiont of Bathyaustriella thionipta]MCU7951797.1 TRAP transporter small permease [gamma proteobacterium symbiont of Bathyaustriella thionipta]MCU7957679.1 TRAP transporter small permease [gamma proteobacterium symbiont of Bathyaustriella thionipta]MCU7968076.1 TRAP transporter small permease [gamma proteobacterium symbiont of Bathy